MRTNIEIDDQLMKRAMRSAKTRTKRATVEEGLRLLIRLKRQQGIRRFRGESEMARESGRIAAQLSVANLHGHCRYNSLGGLP